MKTFRTKLFSESWTKIRLLLLFFPVMAVVFFPSLSCSQAFSSDTLIDRSNQMDGQTVQFRGEIIGDIMARGTHCWINVNDGSQALGIYCPMDMVKSIRFTGDYKHTGDTIVVRGIFHKACPQHGGELDIHAEELRIIQAGTKRDHPVIMAKMYLAISLLLSTILILFLYTYRKKNRTSE